MLKIGINNKYEKKCYDYWIDNNRNMHISKLFLELLNPLLQGSSYQYSYFKSQNGNKENIFKLLDSLRIKEFICIHPGTSDNFKGKRWGEDNFSVLSSLLLNAYDLPLLLTGKAKEKQLISNIISKIEEKDKVFQVGVNLRIWDFIELLKKTSLFISNDTGPMHIAASLGINIVTLFGPTSPVRYRALNENSLFFYKNLECSPCVGTLCDSRFCKNNFQCLDITPEEVFNKILVKFPNV